MSRGTASQRGGSPLLNPWRGFRWHDPQRGNNTSCEPASKEFGIPPIHDGLILGKHSPIGCAAIRKAIDLLTTSPFEHIELEDETVGDVIVRASILRRVPKETLIAFVLERIKPLMGPDDILHMDLDAEITLEDERP